MNTKINHFIEGYSHVNLKGFSEVNDHKGRVLESSPILLFLLVICVRQQFPIGTNQIEQMWCDYVINWHP